MPRRCVLFGFVIGLLVSPADVARALDPAPDDAEPAILNIEDVPTPTALAELLPEGGVGSVEVDYWLTMTMRNDAGRVGNESYYHWSIKPEGETLVFTYRYGFAGNNGRHVHSRAVYSAKGGLVAYRQVMAFASGLTRTTTAEVGADQTVLTTTTTRDDGREPAPAKVARLPAERESGAVPAEWLPLVFAYHIRKGSLGYRYKTINPVGQGPPQANRVVDLGVERVEIDGEPRRAHLLALERAQAGNPQNILTRIKVLVTEAGEVLSMDSASDKYRLVYRRTTAEEAAERFGVELDP
ncbi:MAG: hypothetical protein ACE37H_14340 [Phycisphaeraceae bacterium]